jgi:hypothetical protein
MDNRHYPGHIGKARSVRCPYVRRVATFPEPPTSRVQIYRTQLGLRGAKKSLAEDQIPALIERAAGGDAKTELAKEPRNSASAKKWSTPIGGLQPHSYTGH